MDQTTTLRASRSAVRRNRIKTFLSKPHNVILLLMGIDHFLDMGRSAINVLGNGIATAMLSKNEGLLQEEAPEAEPMASTQEAI